MAPDAADDKNHRTPSPATSATPPDRWELSALSAIRVISRIADGSPASRAPVRPCDSDLRKCTGFGTERADHDPSLFGGRCLSIRADTRSTYVVRHPCFRCVRQREQDSHDPERHSTTALWPGFKKGAGFPAKRSSVTKGKTPDLACGPPCRCAAERGRISKKLDDKGLA